MFFFCWTLVGFVDLLSFHYVCRWSSSQEIWPRSESLFWMRIWRSLSISTTTSRWRQHQARLQSLPPDWSLEMEEVKAQQSQLAWQSPHSFHIVLVLSWPIPATHPLHPFELRTSIVSETAAVRSMRTWARLPVSSCFETILFSNLIWFNPLIFFGQFGFRFTVFTPESIWIYLNLTPVAGAWTLDLWKLGSNAICSWKKSRRALWRVSWSRKVHSMLPDAPWCSRMLSGQNIFSFRFWEVLCTCPHRFDPTLQIRDFGFSCAESPSGKNKSRSGGSTEFSRKMRWI